MRHVAVLALAVAVCLPGPARAATAEELMAQLLVANDIAALCAGSIQRLGARSPNALIADGLLMIVEGHDVTMTDLVAVQQTTAPERMRLLKQAELTRRGVDLQDHRQVCFFARQIVGPDNPIGRYLEVR